MDQFMKINNFNDSLAAFKRYMLDQYSVDVTSVKSIRLEDALYSAMKEVKENNMQNSGVSLAKLNDTALKLLRDTYTDKMRLAKNNKPNMRSLDRDATLFGERPVMTQQILPKNTNTSKDTVSKDFDRLMKIRNNDVSNAPAAFNPAAVSVSEDPLDVDDFQKKLASLEQSRNNNYLLESIETKMPAFNDNPKSLYQLPPAEKAEDVTLPKYMNHIQEEIIPQTSKRILIDRYITINGFDRLWEYYPYRYQYSIDFGKMSRAYKNISTLRFTSLILPMEIIEERTLLSAPKPNYYHENKLSYPYVMLCVDEISDMYDGLNQGVRRCHTTFVVDNTYKAPNGRGYIVMRPLQNEQKQYLPGLLGTIQRLSFSVAKPNGTLFNYSMDNYNITKIDYVTYNDKYLQVTLDKYFDKNEFFVGDSILIRDFKITKPATDPCLSGSDYDVATLFANRPEGHDILQLGEANEAGYTNNFFIYAPGVLDQQIGKLTIDKNVVDAFRYYYEANPINPLSMTKNGRIINASLQTVITMTITLSTGDSSIIGTMSVP